MQGTGDTEHTGEIASAENVQAAAGGVQGLGRVGGLRPFPTWLCFASGGLDRVVLHDVRLVGDELSKRLVPDELWGLVEPLLPAFALHPQGGGTAPADERAVFAAVVFVLTSGCAWRLLPPSFDVTVPTAHRRFTAWTEAGLWRRLHRAVLDELGGQGLIDWSRAVIDAASVRARGSLTGPSPVDRGKPGSKIHVLSDRAGTPLSVGFRPPTPTMPKRCHRWSRRSPRSGRGVGPVGAGPPSFTPTRPTTPRICRMGA